MNQLHELIAEIKSRIEFHKELKSFRKEERAWKRKVDPFNYYLDRFAVTAAVSLFICIILASCGFRFYFNDSIHTGIYKISSDTPKKGDIVTLSLCRCNEYYPLTDRSYTKGNFIRYFAAHAGDRIEITTDGIRINSKLWANSKILKKDAYDRRMLSLLSAGTIPKGKTLVLSKNDKNSFDSRYFGLVPVYMLKKINPILTFN